MKNITITNLVFYFLILTALSACTEKGKDSSATIVKSTSDSTPKAKEDSLQIEEGKDVKDALDVVKK